MWAWRQRWERWDHKPTDAHSHQKLDEAQNRVSREGVALPYLDFCPQWHWVQTLDSKSINCFCFKPPNSWLFVTAARVNEYSDLGVLLLTWYNGAWQEVILTQDQEVYSKDKTQHIFLDQVLRNRLENIKFSHCLSFFLFWHRMAYGILGPWPATKSSTPAMDVWRTTLDYYGSPSHCL